MEVESADYGEAAHQTLQNRSELEQCHQRRYTQYEWAEVKKARVRAAKRRSRDTPGSFPYQMSLKKRVRRVAGANFKTIPEPRGMGMRLENNSSPSSGFSASEEGGMDTETHPGLKRAVTDSERVNTKRLQKMLMGFGGRGWL
uniref:Uncharacterized protein n=1 Tax=Lotharella globosa TaxID=91324 RepID=A0A7S3ZA63_9EUKA|mmetsp:Transcript_2442/g.4743  ORF Transcript_2442/g.4743 Transcript_2442/m.4743 type:complete len:143 (+) Transcript_2442:65-493(+)